MDLGSGIRKKPIPDPGSRGQKGTGFRIPDPDPQHCGLYSSWILFVTLPEKMMDKAGEVGEAGWEAWHLCQQSGQLASFRGHEIAFSILSELHGEFIGVMWKFLWVSWDVTFTTNNFIIWKLNCEKFLDSNPESCRRKRACFYGSFLGSNPDISQKIQYGRNNQKEWPTHSRPPKKIQKMNFFKKLLYQ